MYYIGNKELAALKKLFAKKRLYRYQPDSRGECDLFEKEFSSFVGTKHALLLSSGTNAIVISLLAGGLQPGDEVLVPAYTFVATAAAVVNAGAIPILVNVDANLSICLLDAAKKISKRTRAIIPVHMDGLAANMDAVLRFAKKHNLFVVEDAAQAIGASYKKKKLGSMGLFGCFSLNENKHISCGEGGIVVTSRRELFEKTLCLHDTPAQFNPTKKMEITRITPFIGGSMRVSEIQGTIMRVQLSRMEKILKELRKRKKIYINELSTISGVHCVLGHCADGDASSSIHLQFDDPEKAVVLGKKIRAMGLPFFPVTVRPAHASWKWSHLLGERAHIQAGSNPFLLGEKKYNYPITDVMETVSVLMRTLKMETQIQISLSKTASAAKKLRKILLHG